MRNNAVGILVFPRFQLLDLAGSGAHHHKWTLFWLALTAVKYVSDIAFYDLLKE